MSTSHFPYASAIAPVASVAQCVAWQLTPSLTPNSIGNDVLVFVYELRQLQPRCFSPLGSTVPSEGTAKHRGAISGQPAPLASLGTGGYCCSFSCEMWTASLRANQSAKRYVSQSLAGRLTPLTASSKPRSKCGNYQAVRRQLTNISEWKAESESITRRPFLDMLQTDAKFSLARYKPQLCTLASFKMTCLLSKHITRYLEGPVLLHHGETTTRLNPVRS